MFRWLFGLVACAGAAAVSTTASARVEGSSSYSKPQTFSCALRLLRVERGYEVVEKDEDAAYVLFKYPVAGKKEEANGSLEVVETAAGVRVFVQLPRLPEYHEAILRDALLRKMREEYGPPPVKTPPSKPTPPADKPKPEKPGTPDDPKPDGRPDDES